MNKKIQSLLDGGFITINDVLEHSGYLENQIDDYYHEQYNMEYEQAEHERMMYSENMYGQEDQDMYGNDIPQHIRSSNPEYIIASTSNKMEETYVFEGSSDGKILDLGEYGGIAKRFGDDNWKDHQLAVREAMDNPYRFEREIKMEKDGVRHFLYSRITPADYWDGE